MTKVKETTKEYAIIAKYKESLNKSIEECVLEDALDNLEDTILECESQISHYETSRIPAAETTLKRAERELVKAKKNLETTRFQIAVNLETYLENKRAVQKDVDRAESIVSKAKADLQYEKECLAEYKLIYKDLTATV